jgi:hypothetical protein
LNVGIEIRAHGQKHADALNLDIGDAQALTGVAHLPLDLDGLSVGLVEAAIDDSHAIGLGYYLADDQGEPCNLAEPLAVDARLRRFNRRKETCPLLLAG